MNSIQIRIQPLNIQIGFNVNSIQRTIKPSIMIQCECHSKTDSTIKPANRFQCQFHSKTYSTIKRTNRIQCQIHTNQPLNPVIGFNVNSIQRQIQPLKHQTGFNFQRQIQPLNPEIVCNVNYIQRQI